MSKKVRLSEPTLKVLRFFMTEAAHRRSGAEIHVATGVSSGTLYPLLVRLEEAGWLSSQWEQIDPVQEGRPRRRYYSITGAGQLAARQALSQFQWEGQLAWQV
jgi:PadR family transcriptional regulator PadR